MVGARVLLLVEAEADAAEGVASVIPGLMLAEPADA